MSTAIPSPYHIRKHCDCFLTSVDKVAYLGLQRYGSEFHFHWDNSTADMGAPYLSQTPESGKDQLHAGYRIATIS